MCDRFGRRHHGGSFCQLSYEDAIFCVAKVRIKIERCRHASTDIGTHGTILHWIYHWQRLKESNFVLRHSALYCWYRKKQLMRLWLELRLPMFVYVTLLLSKDNSSNNWLSGHINNVFIYFICNEEIKEQTVYLWSTVFWFEVWMVMNETLVDETPLRSTLISAPTHCILCIPNLLEFFYEHPPLKLCFKSLRSRNCKNLDFFFNLQEFVKFVPRTN